MASCPQAGRSFFGTRENPLFNGDREEPLVDLEVLLPPIMSHGAACAAGTRGRKSCARAPPSSSLLNQTEGRVFQTDTGFSTMKMPAQGSKADWDDFESRVVSDRLFFDYSIAVE